MSTFRTELKIKPSEWQIDFKTPVFTVGSCFSDAIGTRLEINKFPTLINPFGTTYNPISIHKLIHKALKNEPQESHTFLSRGDGHFNYDFHSSISSHNVAALQNTIIDKIGVAHHFLNTAKFLFITYGTAWVYNRRDTGETVANCHKQPGENFEKILLSQEEVRKSFLDIISALRKFNPDLKIILTLSPVRHLKDTLELNSVSKSLLRTACHELANAYHNVEYFPAYEIMMDDLRDYRFYASDMLHPSKDAEEYIWKKFAERYFTNATVDFIEKWQSILAALNHRPFNVVSAQHQEFLANTLNRLKEVGSIVNVDNEVATIASQIINRSSH
jgi:hypothetical protein